MTPTERNAVIEEAAMIWPKLAPNQVNDDYDKGYSDGLWTAAAAICALKTDEGDVK